MAPIDPRLVRRARATRGYLAAGVIVGSATAACVVAQAWLLSRQIAAVFHGDAGGLGVTLGALAGVFGVRAGLAWLQAWLGHRTSAAVKAQLRADVLAARLARPAQAPVSTGGLITLVTQGLDALDGYFAKYLPQLLLAVTVPLVVGVAILTQDLTSAIIVALTVPLIPVFMALVGWMTEARVRRRWNVQQRLAHHFADLVTGLPTLQVFGRARAQAAGLRRIEADHRRETMATLRVSFLSALVLELLSTLSVALVAVGIGLRVVGGHLDLATGLLVLMLAPEVYLPIRQVGVHYHDSADGVAAVEQAFSVIDAGDETVAPTAAAPVPGAPLIELRGVGVRYGHGDAETVALDDFSMRLERGEAVALTGPSGGGKSTALAVLLGLVTPGRGEVLIDGAAPDWAAWRRRVAWVGQTPGLVPGTIADNVALADDDPEPAELAAALTAVGAAELALERPVGDDGAGLSGGERRRVGLARAWRRMATGGEVFILDEPTAGLDSGGERVVIDALRRRGATTLVVTHRPALIAAADRVIELAPEAAR